MKRLVIFLVGAILVGCGEKPTEPSTPTKPLPESAGGQKLSYTAGGEGK